MNRVVLPLTPEQVAQIEPHLQIGRVWLGRVLREPFDPAAGNAGTSGRWMIELGSVPESTLSTLRAAIRKASKAAPSETCKNNP